MVSTFEGVFEEREVDGLLFYVRDTDFHEMAAGLSSEDVEVEQTDFSKPILLSDEDDEESDDDDDFETIPDQLPWDASTGPMDYEAYKAFYADEIEGKFNRR